MTWPVWALLLWISKSWMTKVSIVNLGFISFFLHEGSNLLKVWIQTSFIFFLELKCLNGALGNLL